jgi:hypothetical protein
MLACFPSHMRPFKATKVGKGIANQSRVDTIWGLEPGNKWKNTHTHTRTYLSLSSSPNPERARSTGPGALIVM